jgi:hypothetical protein
VPFQLWPSGIRRAGRLRRRGKGEAADALWEARHRAAAASVFELLVEIKVGGGEGGDGTLCWARDKPPAQSYQP